MHLARIHHGFVIVRGEKLKLVPGADFEITCTLPQPAKKPCVIE